MTPSGSAIGTMENRPRVAAGPATEQGGDPWTVLQDPAATAAAFYNAWLAVQCTAIPRTTSGTLVLAGPGGVAVPVARWAGTARPADLSRLVERALTENRTTIAWGHADPAGGGRDGVVLMVAQPLGARLAGAQGETTPAKPWGAAAVAVMAEQAIGQTDPDGVARQLRSGSGWIEMLSVREGWKTAASAMDDVRGALGRAGDALDALAVLGEHERFQAAAMAIVNELATRLGCSRVSLGVLRHGGARLRAVSNMAVIKRGTEMAGRVEDAMAEASVQDGPIAFPPLAPDAPGVNLAHRALAPAGGAALSVCLPGPEGRTVAVLTLERENEVFGAEIADLATAIAALAGPVIALHLRTERWAAGRLVDTAGDGLRALLGPGRPALKLATGSVAVLLLGMVLATGTHRVSAKASLEGEVQRAAVAPFDGFLLQGPARAGDRVRQGDLLAALDDRELILERAKTWAEREKLRQRHQEAAAKHDRSATAVLAAQIDQAEASLDLAEDKLRRARIVAPVDGLVVSGDLSQMLGAPVERGKVLFEVAPLDRIRLAMQVEDGSIRWVRPGQEGTLRLSSRPGKPLRFRVVARAPVAAAEDNRNLFRVEAVLLDSMDGLRPGMEGIAKVEIGPANLLWVWVHPVVDAIRLFVWKWMP